MKNKQALTLLLVSNAVCQFSQGITMIAIPWYFTHTLDMQTMFGYLYAIITIATIVWNPHAGAIIDRYSRKRIALLVTFCCGIILLIIAVSGFWLGDVSSGLVILIFGLTMFNYNIHYPNLYAFAQEITDKKDYGKVNSYLEIQGQVTMMIAGAIGAVLLSGIPDGSVTMFGYDMYFNISLKAWKLHEIFLLNSSTYFISFAFISLIKYTPLFTRNIETGSINKRIIMGVKYLRDNPLLFIFGNASYSIFVTVMVCAYFTFPVYVSQHLGKGAEVYASSEVFFAVGAVTAGIFTRWIWKYMNTVFAVILMLMITGAIFYTGALTKHTSVFYGISVLLGLCNSGTRIMRVTYLFNHISNDIIGRAGSVLAMINILIRTIFIVLFSLSFFSTGSNIIYTFWIMGSFAIISAIIGMFYYKKLPKN